MKQKLRAISLIAILLQVHGSGLAHHATATQFDTSKMLTVTGVVARLDWGNPHAHVVLEIRRSGETGEQWDIELGSPGAIIVSGLSRDLLKPGTTLTVMGYPGKANATRGGTLCATQVALPDGTIAKFVVGI